MLKHGILIVAFLCLIQSNFAQDESFEKQTAIIAKSIDSITSAEKSAMKKSLEKIEKKIEKEAISSDEAQAEKSEIAQYHAQKINEGVRIQEERLQKIIQDKVNGTLKSEEEKNWKDYTFLGNDDENYQRDSITGLKIEKRFTSQFVIILGANQSVTETGNYYGDGFKVSPFGYGEVGFSFKYRLKEASSLWNFKIGFSVVAMELKPNNENVVFVMDNGKTTLQDAGFPIKKSRLSVGYLTIPMHLEIDLSKPKYDRYSNQSYLRSQTGFRMGVGGFLGVRYYSNQVVKYNDDGKKIRKVERDDFNVNSFTFGPSAYIGYRDISLFARYDVNPVFKNNPTDINNLSFGLRFDFN